MITLLHSKRETNLISAECHDESTPDVLLWLKVHNWTLCSSCESTLTCSGLNHVLTKLGTSALRDFAFTSSFAAQMAAHISFVNPL
jgi:hypothetical protein